MIPTVRVKSSHPDHERGFFVINESDFDPKIHKLWDDSGEETAKTEAERLEAEAKRVDVVSAPAPVEPKADDLDDGYDAATPDQDGHDTALRTMIEDHDVIEIRRRGRPPGSKNRTREQS